MALTANSYFEADTIGTKETIRLIPTPPSVSTQATIASAFYGKDATGTPISIPTDGKSITITVLTGMNALQVTAMNPNKADDLVSLAQGSTVLSSFEIRGHSGISSIFIKGL